MISKVLTINEMFCNHHLDVYLELSTKYDHVDFKVYNYDDIMLVGCKVENNLFAMKEFKDALTALYEVLVKAETVKLSDSTLNGKFEELLRAWIDSTNELLAWEIK